MEPKLYFLYLPPLSSISASTTAPHPAPPITDGARASKASTTGALAFSTSTRSEASRKNSSFLFASLSE